MTTKDAIILFKHNLQSNHKQRTVESYRRLLELYEAAYAQWLWIRFDLKRSSAF